MFSLADLMRRVQAQGGECGALASGTACWRQLAHRTASKEDHDQSTGATTTLSCASRNAFR